MHTASHLSRPVIRRAILAAFPDVDEAALIRATGAAARAMIGTATTGVHGPREDFSYNDSSLGSFRMERRAKDADDIGTLRMLANDADAVGATSHAKHLREYAGIITRSAEIDAYCVMSAHGAITCEAPPRDAFIGPAIHEAYHVPTDMYVEVLREASAEDHTVTFRHPHYGVDRCAPAFLRPYLEGGDVHSVWEKR